MPTTAEKRHFGEALADQLNFHELLLIAIDWVSKNMQPKEVFEVSDLEQWAEDNGYVKEAEVSHD